jgi:outer membrane protein
MRRTATPLTCLAFLVILGLAAPGPAQSASPMLTADAAVRMALDHNSQVIAAHADVLSARGSLYGAFSGVLPQIGASWSRNGSLAEKQTGSQVFGSIVTPSNTTTNESYATTPQLTGSWNVLNLSSIAGLSSARLGLRASNLQLQSARSNVAYLTRQQFYLVVGAVKGIGVANNALQQARESERLVRARFDVGSVARTDVLQAQVQTAQSELDSIAAVQNLLNQRNALASLIGVREEAMGEVDTVLTVTPRTVDEQVLLREAEANRPDIRAADASLRSARAGLASARFLRLPYLSLTGSASINPFRTSTQTTFGDFAITDTAGHVVGSVHDPVVSTRLKTDRQYSASLSVNWDIFDGLATDGRIAQAHAGLLRAQDAYNVLKRNLEADVHLAVITYQQSLGSEAVAEAGLANATENLKLTQQKYNVGSATILDLVTAQVALQRAQSQLVTAQANIRVAEAGIDRVRGVVP